MNRHAHPAATPSIGRLLDDGPVLPFHRKLRSILAFGLLVDGIDTYLVGGISAVLIRTGIATLNEAGQLAIATAIGLALGGLITGFATDRIGRRSGLRINLLLVIIGGFGAALSPSLSQLFVFRFVTAIGLGGETILAYGMMSEFAPPTRRGSWLALLGLVANCGMPLVLLIGYFLLPTINGWRWMLAIPAVLAIIVFFLRWSLPESPRWLEVRGRHAEARAIVARIYGGDQLKSHQSDPGFQHPLHVRGAIPVSRITVAIAINVAVMASIFGFVSWLPTFFAASGRDIATSALFAGVLSLGAPLGTGLGYFLTDRFERKWGVTVAAMVAAGLGSIYSLVAADWAILSLGVLVVTAIYAFGTFGIVGYVPELFPTRTRIRAMGVAATVGRVSIMVLPLLVVATFQRFGQSGVVLLICAVLLATATLVASLGVNTRGRSLEEI